MRRTPNAASADKESSELKAETRTLSGFGATERTILTIFVEVGLLIGLTGTLLGNVFGLGFSWAANRYHFVPLPADVYFVAYLPFTLETSDIVAVNFIAVMLSMTGPPAAFAAFVAARIRRIRFRNDVKSFIIPAL